MEYIEYETLHVQVAIKNLFDILNYAQVTPELLTLGKIALEHAKELDELHGGALTEELA